MPVNITINTNLAGRVFTRVKGQYISNEFQSGLPT